MTNEAIITFEHVAVSFGTTHVHRDISFSIPRGETVTILGPSGTGKTVLLKLIIGLLQPSAGTVRVFGKDLSQLRESELIGLRRRIGMLFQSAALFDSISVFENVAYSLREREDLEEEEIADTVMEKLELVGLANVHAKYPPQLSGGQKKRVGLARALANSPEIILYDEPTTGLDPTAIRLIDELILKLKENFGITQVAVTHDISSAKRFSDRWVLLNEGRVIADGPVHEVTSNNQDVMDFISGNWRSELVFEETRP